MRVRITNKTSAAIIIEDLGITLQQAGGSDSSCIISGRQYADSRDLKSHASWIRVDMIPDAEFVVKRPHLVQSKPDLVQPVIEKSHSLPKSVPETLASNPELVNINNTLLLIDKKLSKIIELLLRPAPEQPQPQIVYVQSSPNAPSQHNTSQSNSDIFIPSSIVPKDVETRIQVKESAVDGSNFDDASKALKKMRKSSK